MALRKNRSRSGAFAHGSNLYRIIIASPLSSNSLNPKLTSSKTSPQLSAASICSMLSTHTTRNLESLLIDFKDKLNSQLVLEILMNYKQLGRFRTLEFFSWAGFQMGFQFDGSVIEYMADFLGRRKLFDDLKCLLITISSNGYQVSPRAISTSIRFLGRQGRVEEALCLFQEMESTFNSKPDNLVYNNMLYVLCKKKCSAHFIDVAITIFRRIESPDAYSYSNILVGMCKIGKFETALECFHEMGRAGLVPTRSAVNVLIGELCSMSSKDGAIERVRVTQCGRPFTILVPNVSSKTKSGAIEPASKVFWAGYQLGCLPSGFVITMLISELCRLGRMREAVDVLKVIEERKLRCVEECYTVVIKALCENNSMDEVTQLFERMVSQDLKPKLVVYSSMICMLCKLGNLGEAERVFKIMNKKRCLPDNVTYTALIEAYSEIGNWEIAYGLLMEMLGVGWYPHLHTCNLVDELLRKHNRVDLCNKLEGKMEMQMLQKHCKEGQLEVAYEKMRSMLQKGIYPPIYIRDAFERAFQKSGKLNTARELLQGIDKVMCEADERAIRCSNQL